MFPHPILPQVQGKAKLIRNILNWALFWLCVFFAAKGILKANTELKT